MRKKLLTAVDALAALFATVLPVGAGPLSSGTNQTSADRAPYIVLMTGEPVVAYEGGVPGLAGTAPPAGEKVDGLFVIGAEA